MADSLSVAVERLRTSSERLNAISDLAAQAVRNTETYLQELNIGVIAVVDLGYDFEEDGGNDELVQLGYVRTDNGRFRIVILRVSATASDRSDAHITPWAECSRDEKLHSFERLPDLLTELVKKLDERIQKAEQTVSAVTKLLPTTKKKKGA